MKRLLSTLLLALLCAACARAEGYTQIDQETAWRMMEADDGHVIVDVRRQDEYDAGHIPGAILIPNESIGCDSPEALPDYDQVILVYCRSGNRSKQAAQKLFDKILTCTVVLKLVSFRAHIQSRRCLQYVNIESSSIPQKNALG